eukprot:517058_1
MMPKSGNSLHVPINHRRGGAHSQLLNGITSRASHEAFTAVVMSAMQAENGFSKITPSVQKPSSISPDFIQFHAFVRMFPPSTDRESIRARYDLYQKYYESIDNEMNTLHLQQQILLEEMKQVRPLLPNEMEARISRNTFLFLDLKRELNRRFTPVPFPGKKSSNPVKSQPTQSHFSSSQSLQHQTKLYHGRGMGQVRPPFSQTHQSHQSTSSQQQLQQAGQAHQQSSQSYQSPQSISSQSHQPPSQSRKPPSQSHQPPSQSHQPPSQSHQAPSQSHQLPRQSHQPPSQSHQPHSQLYQHLSGQSHQPPSQSHQYLPGQSHQFPKTEIQPPRMMSTRSSGITPLPISLPPTPSFKGTNRSLYAPNPLSGISRPPGDDDFTQPHKKRRTTLPKEAVSVLRTWLFNHFQHPYPTEEEKKSLAIGTGLQVSQVNYWFINARVRIWRPMLRAAGKKPTAAPGNRQKNV